MYFVYRRATAGVCTMLLSVLALSLPANAVGSPEAEVVSANPVDTTPHVIDGTVLAVAAVGSRIYVGGDFTTVRDSGSSTELRRTNLFAFDRATGKVVQSYQPQLDGTVESIAAAPDGTSIIVAGRFETVDGAAQRSLAMLDADGTRVPSFAGQSNGYVNKVLVRGSRLIVGGRFSTVDNQERANLAVLEASTGALDEEFTIGVAEARTRASGVTPGAAVQEMDADAAGERLVIVGNFRQVGDQRRQQIAMIDLPGRKVADWYTNRYSNDISGSAQAYQCYDNFDTQMRDVEFSPDGSYFVVVTSGGAPDSNAKSLCDTAARWESAPTVPSGGASETWRNCTGGDSLLSVATTGAAVYVGGHQRWMDNCGGDNYPLEGSFAADGVAAIDPTTGLAIRTWNPGRTRGIGAEEMVAASEGVYIGSDTTTLNGENHGRLGLFPTAIHHPVISLEAVCNTQTGLYDGTVVIASDADYGKDWEITSATATPVGVQGLPLDVRQDDQTDFVGRFAGLPPGTTLSVAAQASWFDKGAGAPNPVDLQRSAALRVPQGCGLAKPPAPPPSSPPTTTPTTPPTPSEPASPQHIKVKPRIKHHVTCGSVRLTADNRRSQDGRTDRATVRYRIRIGSWSKVYKVPAGRRLSVQRKVGPRTKVKIKAVKFHQRSWSGRTPGGCRAR